MDALGSDPTEKQLETAMWGSAAPAATATKLVPTPKAIRLLRESLKETPDKIEQNKNFYIETFGEEAYKQAIATFQ
jgi:hypothetical protein